MTDTTKLRRWVRELRKAFPVGYPLRVIQVHPRVLQQAAKPGNRDFGDCIDHRDRQGRLLRFTIRLDRTANNSQTADVLVHEYAHALRVQLPAMPGDTDHDEVFSVIHGRIWRHWFGERAERAEP